MRRDMELIRKMALAIEESPSGVAPDRLELEGYTDEQVGYHAHLMIQAGLATGAELTIMSGGSPTAMLRSLTWEGHEFIEAARDEGRWDKAMEMVQEKGGSVTISVLTQLLVQLMKQGFGLG